MMPLIADKTTPSKKYMGFTFFVLTLETVVILVPPYSLFRIYFYKKIIYHFFSFSSRRTRLLAASALESR